MKIVWTIGKEPMNSVVPAGIAAGFITHVTGFSFGGSWLGLTGKVTLSQTPPPGDGTAGPAFPFPGPASTDTPCLPGRVPQGGTRSRCWS